MGALGAGAPGRGGRRIPSFVYPAAAAGWSAGEGSQPTPSHVPYTIKLCFEMKVETQWGDTVVLVGSSPQFGSWNPHQGLRLSTSEHTYPAWSLQGVRVRCDCDILEYKVVVIRAPDGSGGTHVDWEPLAGNRTLNLLDTEADELSITGSWGSPDSVCSIRTRNAPGSANVSPTPTTNQAVGGPGRSAQIAYMEQSSSQMTAGAVVPSGSSMGKNAIRSGSFMRRSDSFLNTRQAGPPSTHASGLDLVSLGLGT